MESLSLCMEQGLRGKQIIAMQGPFSEIMNEAVIYQYGISCLVTKQSGRSGGYPEKLQAANKAGIPVFSFQSRGTRFMGIKIGNAFLHFSPICLSVRQLPFNIDICGDN